MPEQKKPAAEKTEQPTQRKLKKAREKGQVPKSEELPSVVILLMLSVALALVAPKFLEWFSTQIKMTASTNTAPLQSSTAFIHFINTKLMNLTLLIVPVFSLLFAGAILANVVVSGLNISSEPVKPKLQSINPINGAKKLINAKSFVKLGLSILKLSIVTFIIFFYLRNKLDTLENLRWAWSNQILITIAKIIFGLMLRIVAALLIVAITDVLYQKFKHLHDLKMTKQEVKEERKETEGSPELKTRIRKTQIQMAMQRIRQEVPKASIVLVNPTHYAVALKYEAKTMESPILVAKGADYIAEKIREIARAYGVPIVRKPELTRTLYSTVKPGESIPQNLYMAVAEVLAMIYRMKQKKH